MACVYLRPTETNHKNGQLQDPFVLGLTAKMPTVCDLYLFLLDEQ